MRSENPKQPMQWLFLPYSALRIPHSASTIYCRDSNEAMPYCPSRCYVLDTPGERFCDS